MSHNGRYHNPPGGHTSHNLFSWSDGTESDQVQARTKGRSSVRTAAYQMGSQIVFGNAEEENTTSNVRRPGSQRKQDEMSGSGIFGSGPVNISSSAYASNLDQNNGNYITDRPSVRLHHPAGGASNIIFGDEDRKEDSTRKILSPMKQLELSGSSEGSEDTPTRKNFSDRKIQEMNGTISIFQPPPEPVAPIVMASPQFSSSHDEVHHKNSPKPVGGRSQIVFGDNEEPVVPEIKRVSEQKIKDLIGTGEYKDEPPVLPVSKAKIRELRGCDIFKDEQPQIRDSLSGIRQPPGGECSITLI